MSPSGVPPGESWDRITPAPRLARGEPSPDGLEGRHPGSPGPEPADPMVVSTEKPDRSRMAPLSLDHVSSRKLAQAWKTEHQGYLRRRRSQRMDRWLLRWVLVSGGVLLGGALWWAVRSRPAAPDLPRAADIGRPDGRNERAMRMLAGFLAAPDVAAKSGHVLDRARVLPLMRAADAAGYLPEATLSFGVPVPLEEGITLVPAMVAGPPGFPLHLVVKEVDGIALLDWETYEQEMTRRFLNFAAVPGTQGGDFRVMIERAHGFDSGPDPSLAIRVAAPGSAALAQAVGVGPQAHRAITAGLPWNQRRRALVRLDWETPSGLPSRLVLREVVRWDFLP